MSPCFRKSLRSLQWKQSFSALTIVVSLAFLSLLTACSQKQASKQETETKQETRAIENIQQPTIALNTRGFINHLCHWPGEKAFTPLIKYDDRTIYCSQANCHMYTRDIIGVLPPGTPVRNIGGNDLVKIKVEKGNNKNDIGYLLPYCVDWNSSGKNLTGSPQQQLVTIDQGTYSERKAYVRQVEMENVDARYYSGYKGKVTLSGPKGTVMNYYDPDTTRPGALTESIEFMADLREKGFKKVIFKNGDGTWEINLSKEPAEITEK